MIDTDEIEKYVTDRININEDFQFMSYEDHALTYAKAIHDIMYEVTFVAPLRRAFLSRETLYSIIKDSNAPIQYFSFKVYNGGKIEEAKIWDIDSNI